MHRRPKLSDKQMARCPIIRGLVSLRLHTSSVRLPRRINRAAAKDEGESEAHLAVPGQPPTLVRYHGT
jgi:hypothetical protein